MRSPRRDTRSRVRSLFFAPFSRTQIALASHRSLTGTIVGGCIGHSLCTGLAVLGGRMLATKISEKNTTIGGGVTFLVFGIHALFFEA